MGLIRNVAIVALCAGAYMSNPDQSSFRQFVENEMKKDSKASWLERKVISHLTANVYERENYYLFSLVRVPEDNLAFIGLFGQWFHLPLLKPKSPR